MNKELSRGFGNVEVVFEEALDCEQGFVVEGFDRALLEYLLKEGFAEGCGEMIDKSCDTEVIVAYDILFGVEYLTYFDSYLRLLEGTCKILNAHNGSTDTDIYLSEEFGL